MTYTGLQRTLISKATEYSNLGYKIGFAKGKEFLAEYKLSPAVMTLFGSFQSSEPEAPEGFDGISVIPEDFVCVDLDINDFGVIWMGALPPTWKERTPRGWHLFYKLQFPATVYINGVCSIPERTTKIKWQPHVDLLIKNSPKNLKLEFQKVSKSYGKSKKGNSLTWGEHVLVSPTPGYTLRYPEDGYLHKEKLTLAPQWLVDALEKQA